MKAKINFNAIDESFLEPYIGWKFEVIKIGKTVSWVNFSFINGQINKKKVRNKYLDF